MLDDRSPLGLGLTGVVLIIVGLAVKALIPKLVEVGSFVVGAGWVLIAIAVVLFLIQLVKGGAPRP
jgi:predicted acyltransferase